MDKDNTNDRLLAVSERVGNPPRDTTLTTSLTVPAGGVLPSTLILRAAVLTGWTTDTRIIAALSPPGAMTEAQRLAQQTIVIGTRVGNTITKMTTLRHPSSQTVYPVGSHVLPIIDSAQARLLFEWGTVEHKKDGTHGAITADSLSIGGVAIDPNNLGGLDQAAVDARIADRLPTATTAEADSIGATGASTDRRIYTAARIRRGVLALVNAVVPAWARDSSTQIPADKLGNAGDDRPPINFTEERHLAAQLRSGSPIEYWDVVRQVPIAGAEHHVLVKTGSGDGDYAFRTIAARPEIAELESEVATLQTGAADLDTRLNNAVDVQSVTVSSSASYQSTLQSQLGSAKPLILVIDTAISGSRSGSAYNWAAGQVLWYPPTSDVGEPLFVLPQSTGTRTADTAAQIKTKLETLAGDARLDASAVKDLPEGGSGVSDIYVSPSTFTKSAGAKSLYVSINSLHTTATNVQFDIGGISKNANYTGGTDTLQVDLTTADVANLIAASSAVIRVQANIRDSSNTSLERLEVDILKVNPATGGGTADTAQQIVAKIFTPVAVNIAGASTSLAFDVGTAGDVSGSSQTYTGGRTYTISAGQFAQGDTLTADYVVNNPVIQGSDPFDVEVRMLKSSDNSVIDEFNIGKSADGQLTHTLEEADTIKFQLNIKTPGRYAGTLVISNLQIQSTVAPAQPGVRRAMAKPLSDLRQELQHEISDKADDLALSYAIVPINTGTAIGDVNSGYVDIPLGEITTKRGTGIVAGNNRLTLSPGTYEIIAQNAITKTSTLSDIGSNRANLRVRWVENSTDVVIDEQRPVGYLRGFTNPRIEASDSTHVFHLDEEASVKLQVAEAEQGPDNPTWATAAGGRVIVKRITTASEQVSDGQTQAQVDARIRALVADPAEQGNASAWPTSKIPNLNASKINAGTFNQARIPGLPASRITSGAFATTRIPSLSADKITSGRFTADRLPTTVPSTTNLQITNIWFGTQAQYDALASAQKSNNNYLHYIQE